MFEMFKKQPITTVAKKVRGFFSPDAEMHPKLSKDIIKRQNLLKKTFQRDASDFVAVNPDGSKFAMDDALSQPIPLKIGYADNVSGVLLEYYTSQGFIGWQACAMLDQFWLIRKACSMPAKDACRHGYEVTSNDGSEIKPEILDFIRQKDKEFGIKGHCVDFIAKGRVFGMRIAMFHVDSQDPDYYLKPFNPDGIKKGSYRGISLIDPTWITPELDFNAVSNPASQHFYEPTWWRINAQRIHRTHLVIFRNGRLPDILKPTYFYGGVPVPQMIMERVYAAERTANEAPMLAMTKRLTVIKCDTTKAIENPEAFSAQMEIWTQFQNNFGVKLIANGEEEDIQQFDTSLADLDAVIMTQYQLVAAAAGVPATKLLGTSPKGFNASGEFEESSYHEELESIQEHDLSPLVERHHLLLIRSEVVPKFGCPVFSTEVNWHPVDSPTAAELADINLKKSQTDSALAVTGAVDWHDIRARLIGDKDSGYNGMELEVDLAVENDEEEIVESAKDEEEKWITVNGKHVKINGEGEIIKGNIGQKSASKKDYRIDEEVERIEPPHQVQDNKKLDALVAKMQETGWQGRPILAWEDGQGGQFALTGSHRIAAAKKAEIDIPIQIIEGIEGYENSQGYTINDMDTDEERYEFIKEYGDKEATSLMNEELKENNK